MGSLGESKINLDESCVGTPGTRSYRWYSWPHPGRGGGKNDAIPIVWRGECPFNYRTRAKTLIWHSLESGGDFIGLCLCQGLFFFFFWGLVCRRKLEFRKSWSKPRIYMYTWPHLFCLCFCVCVVGKNLESEDPQFACSMADDAITHGCIGGPGSPTCIYNGFEHRYRPFKTNHFVIF